MGLLRAGFLNVFVVPLLRLRVSWSKAEMESIKTCWLSSVIKRICEKLCSMNYTEPSQSSKCSS